MFKRLLVFLFLLNVLIASEAGAQRSDSGRLGFLYGVPLPISKRQVAPECPLCSSFTISCGLVPSGTSRVLPFPECVYLLSADACSVFNFKSGEQIPTMNLWVTLYPLCENYPIPGNYVGDPSDFYPNFPCQACHERVHLLQCRSDLSPGLNCNEATAGRAGLGCLRTQQQLHCVGAPSDPWPPLSCTKLCAHIAEEVAEIGFNDCVCAGGSCDSCEAQCIARLTAEARACPGVVADQGAIAASCRQSRTNYCRM